MKGSLKVYGSHLSAQEPECFQYLEQWCRNIQNKWLKRWGIFTLVHLMGG